MEVLSVVGVCSVLVVGSVVVLAFKCSNKTIFYKLHKCGSRQTHLCTFCGDFKHHECILLV